MLSSPDVSIVVPVFNGAAELRTLVSEVFDTLGSMNLTGEIVFVDDCSGDQSWRIVRELRTEYGEAVRGFRLARNSGQQAATYCGLLHAAGTWIVTIDDDLQLHPREIRKLWDRAQATNADVVFGVYATLHHGLLHRIGTRLLRALLRRVAPAFPDGSSFRLIRAEIARSLPRHLGPWVLVDPVLAWHTSDVTSVEVEHGRRESGRSGYTFWTLASLGCTLLFTYSRLPLRILTGVGLLAAIVSFALGLHYLIQKVTVGAQLGFSALIVTITFSSGIMLLGIGILGEYISRIHMMGSGEPAFTIKARVDA